MSLPWGWRFGVFTGMLPIMPFHMILAIALALFFKGSKITAMLGSWISNPFDWVFIYYFNYKIGSVILGLSENDKTFSSLMGHLRGGEEGIDLISDLISSGGTIVAAFLIGGLIMGIAAGIPSYFIFLKVFRYIRKYGEKRKFIKSYLKKKDQG